MLRNEKVKKNCLFKKEKFQSHLKVSNRGECGK